MIRIGSTPILCGLIVNGNYEEAMYLFLASGALDWADGFIARNVPGQSSVLGSFLDPFADKVLIAGTTLALATTGLLSPWVVGVIVARDVGLVVASFIHRARTRPPGVRFFSTTDVGSFRVNPTFLSKLNTTLQIALVAGALAAPSVPWISDSAVSGLGAIVVGTTVASWWDYFRAYQAMKAGAAAGSGVMTDVSPTKEQLPRDPPS